MWTPTNLQITVIGLLVDEAYKSMKSIEPDRFKQIEDLFTDIATEVDTTIAQNEQGELALCADGVYYPIRSGQWVQEERVIDSNLEPVEYNALVSFGGLNHLLLVEPINH